MYILHVICMWIYLLGNFRPHPVEMITKYFAEPESYFM